VIKKEAEKILKYETCREKVTPVITEATGTISKSRRQYLSNITENNTKKL
jgi:hypothetical protein